MGLGDRIYRNPVVHNSVIAAAIVGFVSSISVSVLVFLASHFMGIGMPFLTLLEISLIAVVIRITSYNVCYTKLLRPEPV